MRGKAANPSLQREIGRQAATGFFGAFFARKESTRPPVPYSAAASAAPPFSDSTGSASAAPPDT